MNTDGASTRKRYHDTYYLSLIAFEVEDTLFRVPKNRFLSLNPAFFGQFAPSKRLFADDSVAEAGDEDQVIQLNDVSAESFHGLLLVLYPFERTASSYEEWLGALDLATRWTLPEVRLKAISALSALNASAPKTSMEIIPIAKRYKIKTMLRDAYAQVVTEHASWTTASLRQQAPGLDLETITRLLELQLQLSPSNNPVQRPDTRCSNCAEGYTFVYCWHYCVSSKRENKCSQCQGGQLSQCAYICDNWKNQVQGLGARDKGTVAALVERIFAEELATMTDM